MKNFLWLAAFELNGQLTECKFTYPTEDFDKNTYNKIKFIQNEYFDS